jgi:hypothetical protein
MTSGCYYFKVEKSEGDPQTTLKEMQASQKYIVLHLEDKKWHFTDLVIAEESVTGTISPLSIPESIKPVKTEGPNRYKKRTTHNETYIINQVHIYVTEFVEADSSKISVPIEAIKKIEIYDKDKEATAASFIFGTVGLAASAFAVLLIIVALTKSSCPFVYVNNGSQYVFTGEIFSGATQPGIERDDFLSLPALAPAEGEYRLKLTNEVHEIQYVNFAELLIFDHPTDATVLIDKYGTPQTLKDIVPPIEAKNKSGLDIKSAINTKDSLYYSGDIKSTGKDGIEEVFLKFSKPVDAKSAKLVIRAKNSFWLDILFAKFHKLFGEKYNNFSEKQESASAVKLNQFLLDQNIPMSVYIEKNGAWEFVDYFNIAGPMAMRDDVLALNLEGNNSDTIKLMLKTGFLFWEIDYAGIDFSSNETYISHTVPMKSALDKLGNDVKTKLASKDNDYLALKETGDETGLVFDIPTDKAAGRTVFLHSRGYYKILREQTGKADLKALKSFKKPNRFPEFSKEMYELLPVK